MKKYLVIISSLLILFTTVGCFYTSRIKGYYNNGARLTASDVVLFAGFNGEHSRISNNMLDQTERMLKKYGVKVLYLHHTNFNSEIVKAGFAAVQSDINNEEFLDRMAQVYGLTYVFTVNDFNKYNGDVMSIDRTSKLYEESGIVFEVFSVADRQVVASIQLSGDTIQLILNDNDDDNVDGGSIYKNYAKGLRKLMKASK